MIRKARGLLFAVAVLSLVGVSCGSDEPGRSTGPASGTGDITGQVTVFAASSLTAAFTEVGAAFTAAHPETPVRFNFAASPELVTQIGEGAPADVMASADLSNILKLTDAGQAASEPTVFATNTAAILVESGNPKAVAGVADLARHDLIVVQCAPEVPCGKYAEQVVANAGVTVTPKSLEQSVKAVVSKVVLGEADAGIVYATDIAAAGTAAEGVEIPVDINVVARYPIVAVRSARNPSGATAFIDFVLSEVGRTILASHGFGPA